MNEFCLFCSGAVSSQISEIDDKREDPAQVDVRRELVMLSLPAIGGQAIDPIVQLLETAYIGRLGKIGLFCFHHPIVHLLEILLHLEMLAFLLHTWE